MNPVAPVRKIVLPIKKYLHNNYPLTITVSDRPSGSNMIVAKGYKDERNQINELKRYIYHLPA